MQSKFFPFFPFKSALCMKCVSGFLFPFPCYNFSHIRISSFGGGGVWSLMWMKLEFALGMR